MTKRKFDFWGAISLVLTMAFSLAVLPVGAVDQPYMKAARKDLNNAEANLRKATADKGGHRAKAMELVASAISEVNQGIAYDRRTDTGLPEFFEETSSSPADQPFMERAKDNLKDAHNNLEKATADKGGHRAKAIDLVRDAIEEVNKGIEFDRKH
jgi:hypothetical protein